MATEDEVCNTADLQQKFETLREGYMKKKTRHVRSNALDDNLILED